MNYDITPQELTSKMDHGEPIHIIDIREDYEVQTGMLKGAEHIPMNTIPDHMHTFKQGEPYYIVCAHGVRSEKVTDYLREHDFDAYNVTGGMAAF
ncbi:rhodanese-like domain-containing protein [Macrococcus hajekii]|uniref:Rhodanese-like domain-containing protein n=1 Tax=Macrococcus hajekii TaxID=198482 RepID=A0A4R6BLI5_9STAP|nr:rhodanese-like domain-containing protein [Macrococcus hajekii]TDM02649.1 rhodanese-like domain-containing protein [Macrococcus hajekii]GGB02753.1 rhodanese-like domain-containing protein [Macrococcus hajekii]